MNPSFSTLPPLFTVPNFQQRLTAARPVQVYTYVFPKEEDIVEDELRPLIGTLYPFRGIPSLPPHNHEHHEIAIVTAGSAIHQTSAGTQPIGPGHIVAVAPAEVHGFHRIEHLHLINCTYLSELLLDDVSELRSEEGLVPLFLHTALFNKAHRFRVPEWQVSQEVIHACLHDLADIADERKRERPSQVFMKWGLKKVMMRLYRSFTASGENTHLVTFDPLIQEALDHIEEHLAQGTILRVSFLARKMRMSPDYFSRSFREATGWSPMDYFQRRRIQQACSMLLDSGRTTTEIAHTLGYSDSAHFCHLFKRYRGMTPKKFRETYNVLRDAC